MGAKTLCMHAGTLDACDSASTHAKALECVQMQREYSGTTVSGDTGTGLGGIFPRGIAFIKISNGFPTYKILTSPL